VTTRLPAAAPAAPAPPPATIEERPAPPPRSNVPGAIAVTPAPARPAADPPAAAPPAAAPPAPAPGAAQKLKLEVLVYADSPAGRMVFINGRKYVEGQTVEEGVVIEAITEEGVVLNAGGRRVVLRQ
jgi:hypothetical protein